MKLAIVLLFVIGFISFRQFIDSQFFKKYLTEIRTNAILLSNPALERNSENEIGEQCHPTYPLASTDQIHHLAKLWSTFNCPKNVEQAPKCNFVSLGRHLLDHAINNNVTLLTVQIGAMDGKSNDPMYSMFASDGLMRRLFGNFNFTSLKNWLPVLIEPTPDSYQKLVYTYRDIEYQKNLPCSIPMNAAVTYGTDSSKCVFCRFNVSPDAPKICADQPDFVKYQINTLDCEYMRKYHGKQYDTCIIEDPIPCGTVKTLLEERLPYLGINASTIAMMQIDVESHEYNILPGLLKEFKDNLPAIVHFENKVMKDLDIKNPLKNGEKRLDTVYHALEQAGYTLYEEREDTLALRLNPSTNSSTKSHLL